MAIGVKALSPCASPLNSRNSRSRGLISKLTLKAPVEEFELTMLARHLEIGEPPIENV